MRFQVNNLSAGYTLDSRVVKNLSVGVEEGEILCLLGRNGAGKTTSLKAIMGLIPFTEGDIQIDGKQISGLFVEEMADTGIGYVPQGRRLFGELTVKENLQVGAYTRRHRQVRYERIFELFPRLKERLSQVSETLSGGEQQMLAMARALVLDPKVLLLDEPFEGLMPSMVSGISEAIQQMAANGVSVVMVEQRLEVVKSIARRISLMDRGTISRTMSVEEFSADEDSIHNFLSV